MAVVSGACRGAGPDAEADTGAEADAGAGAGPDADTGAEADAPSWLSERAGDATTTFEISDRSFDLSARILGLSARTRFADGEEIFEEFFSPGSGLGPDFNANGCNSCHVNNGRQAAPLGDGYLGIGPVVHVSAPGASATEAPFDLPGYGTRLQTYALEGETEAQVNLLWENVAGQYLDGTPYELRRPIVSVVGREGLLPADAELSLRIPPPMAGPGLLEFIPEADLLDASDPHDLDGDGISGRVNLIADDAGDFRVGRHGWKAENFDLIHQSAGALAEDLGITTSLNSLAGGAETADGPGAAGDGIEISDADLADLAFYIEGLAIPAGRDVTDPAIVDGANLFAQVGCTGCHTPQQRTGPTNTPELDDLIIFPFTDLLLHDLGPGLDDGRPVYAASGAEWRTSALWGIGLSATVNGHVSLLHDGRARSVEEAILWHGGEAETVTAAFRALPAADRERLIQFVNSR